MKKAKQYILVYSAGGLIDRAVIYTNLDKARQDAKDIWDDCDPETDDVKVLGDANGETIYWMPPHEDLP